MRSSWLRSPYIAKTLLVMRLTAVLLIVFMLQVSAKVSSQNVSYVGENVRLESLFSSIERQTGYVFIYKKAILREFKPVTIKASNVPLTSFLENIFEDQPFEFTIKGKNILIYADRNTVFRRYFPGKLYAPTPMLDTVIDVRGKVVNQNQEPVEGATVTVKGSRKAATTDAFGFFRLNGVDRTATIIVSSVNMEIFEMKLNGRANLTISLTSRTTALNDVTVTASTGYQTISRERSTGAYNVISRSQLEKPTTNLATRLIGTTAGLQAKLDENGNPTFRLRGQTTLIPEDAVQPLAQQPLVVLDGFPIQGDFSTINPNDIESITVLKDAAAASIWGARAANGVIVVVSRNARKGTPLKVELTAFTRMGKKFDLDYVNPLATSAETVEYEKASFNNWSAQTVSGSLMSDYYKAFSLGSTAMSEHNLGYISLEERDAILARLASQSNKSQISDYLLANPSTQQYNLSLSGSTGKMTNNLSFMFEDNQSNFKKTDDRKYMLNFRTTSNIFKWLDLNVGGLVQYNKLNTSGVTLPDIQGFSPYEMLVNEDGSLTKLHRYYYPILERDVPMNLFPYSNWYYNPIEEINNRKITSEQLNARLQAGLTFKLMKGLNFDSRVQWELFNTYNRTLNNENTFAVRDIVNTSTGWDQATNTFTQNLPKGSTLAQNRSRGQSYNWRNQLSFNRRFGQDHEVNAIVGTETNNRVNETFVNPTTYGYNDETLTTGLFPNGPGGTFKTLPNWLGQNQTFGYTNTFSYRTERFFSYYGNVAYTFQNKYTISGSFRTDAANIISDDPKYRYDPFWSVGAAWQVYKEKFFRNISTIDMLAVRLTYGYNGNVDRSTAFQPLINQAATPNVYTNDQTATISSFGNPSLRWEKTGTWNLGIDYSILKNRLFGKIDVYRKLGTDLIATISIPAVNGTTSQKLNNAAMTNRGIEIELGTYLPIKGRDISWQGNVNFSYNKNEITRLFVATYASSTLAGGGSGAYVVGEDANSLWRFEYAGIQNSQPMIKGPKGTLYDFGAFAPGDGREYMLNMGTSVAPYTLGFLSNFKIYDFNLSFIVTGKFGHVYQRKGFNYPPTWTTRVLPNKKITEVVNGDPSKIVPLPLNLIEPRYYFWDRFHQSLSYLIENASHIRMQEVNLTYTLRRSPIQKINFTRLQLFAQANDLFTVYANNADEDPEYPLGTMNPRPRLTLGLKCEF